MAERIVEALLSKSGVTAILVSAQDDSRQSAAEVVRALIQAIAKEPVNAIHCATRHSSGCVFVNQDHNCISAIPLKRIREIASHFGLSSINSVAPLPAHHDGTTSYKIVTNSDRFFLKLSKTSHSVERIETILRIQKALANIGAPCASPISCDNGFHLPIREGIAALWYWVEGRQLDRSLKAMRRIGETAATFHTCFQPLDNTEWPPRMPTLNGFLASIGRELPRTAAADTITLLELIDYLASCLQINSNAHCGFIHGDLQHHNILVTPKGACILIDFDNSEFGPLAKDLGIALYFATHLSPETFASRAFSILAGYSLTTDVSSVELSDVVQHMQLKGVEIVAWTLLRFLREFVSFNHVLSVTRHALAAYGMASAILRYPSFALPCDWKAVMVSLPACLSGKLRKLLLNENT